VGLEWVRVSRQAPYFELDSGEPWTPIGDNNAIDWPELSPLYCSRDPAAVEAFLHRLKERGVTVIRLMLEYAHRRHRWWETPDGRPRPNIVRFWDDLFALCERVGLRILLTPMDTYFQWVNWHRHPWNVANGGPCESREQLMICPAVRARIKARLEFVARRWGGSGALFAWDLWNEMHPAQGANLPDAFADYIADVSPWLRALERELHGRAHPQTVSVFGPELVWKPWLKQPIFRSPGLDFTNTHLYEEGTIDDPRDTVAPAVAAGRLIAEAVNETLPERPVFDSEHGPIHRWKDKHRALPPAFDAEYFRHIQWAHLASGGAGGGMRWPNRSPHVLTDGMREEQRRLAGFLPLIDWQRFRRRALTGTLTAPGCAVFGCADGEQAVVYLLRCDAIGRDGTLRADAEPIQPGVTLPGMAAGRYRLSFYATRGEGVVGTADVEHAGGALAITPPSFVTDLVAAVRSVSATPSSRT
jgi:mannan endo-1,4-beta-mannosidase